MAGPLSGAGFNYMVMYHLDFSTKDSYVLRPGHVNISVAHAPAGKRAHVSFGDLPTRPPTRRPASRTGTA